MKTLFHKSKTLALFLGLFIIAVGCDSNDNEDAAASFDQMGEMMQKSFNVFGAVAVDVLLSPVSETQPAKSQPVYDCDASGTVTYDASGTNLYNLIFDDCDGLSGDVDMGLTTNFTETGFDFSLSLDGNLTEACEMSLNNFSMVVAATESGEDQIVLNGSIGSTCNGEAFSCTFTQDALNEGNEDTLFNDNCSGSVG
ncbi:MAG: hypothetical protein AAF564_02120 [Bacteroidota bacterium]